MLYAGELIPADVPKVSIYSINFFIHSLYLLLCIPKFSLIFNPVIAFGELRQSPMS